MRSCRISAKRGFTLMESALATLIIGVGFVASMQLYLSLAQQHASAFRVAMAAQLGNGLREIVMKTPGYGTIDNGTIATNPQLVNGQTYCPPVVGPNTLAAMNKPLTSGSDWQLANGDLLSNYAQSVAVYRLAASDLSSSAGNASDVGLKRVVITVSYRQGPSAALQPLYSLSFLMCNLN